jgi:hypothetical protein
LNAYLIERLNAASVLAESFGLESRLYIEAADVIAAQDARIAEQRKRLYALLVADGLGRLAEHLSEQT